MTWALLVVGTGFTAVILHMIADFLAARAGRAHRSDGGS